MLNIQWAPKSLYPSPKAYQQQTTGYLELMQLLIDKGADVKSRVRGNFGMAHPEGYRKVKRLYDLAGRFGLPFVGLSAALAAEVVGPA